jgi:hypothetical protein
MAAEREQVEAVYVESDEPAPYVSPEDFAERFEAARRAHPRLVFNDDLEAFRNDLLAQLNKMFAAMARRIERRVEKRVGDRAESMVLDVLRRAGYGRAIR